MKICTRCNINKNTEEYGKDKRATDGCNSACKPCEAARGREIYSKNREAELQRSLNYRLLNKDKEILRGKKYRDEHEQELSLSRKLYKKNNKETIALKNKEHAQNNPGKVNAKTRKYQASKIQRTPEWLSTELIKEIESIYVLAKELEKTNNKKHHVDHIVPLQGKNVSGLHVPWNLQILESNVNQSKGNRI